MSDQIRKLLDSELERDRNAGWRQLCQVVLDGSLKADPVVLAEFMDRLRAEPKFELWRRGVEALLAEAISAKQQKRTHALDFATWFWQPFRGTSAVLRAVDPERRRDEDAAIELARLLPKNRFPKAVFIRSTLDDPRWQQILTLAKVVGLVGRPGIYGPEVVQQFDTSSTRFFFPEQCRPPNLSDGAIDPKHYHRIEQRRGTKTLGAVFETVDDGEFRTDYGLIQRFYQREHERHVFLFSGCSTLATLGTVLAAALFAERHIPLPDGQQLDSTVTFEALITVRAKSSQHPWQWDPETPFLLRMLIGDEWEWFPQEGNPKEGKWGHPVPDELFLIRNASGQVDEVRANDPTGRVLFRSSESGTRGVLAKFIELVFRLSNGQPGVRLTDSQLRQQECWKTIANSNQGGVYKARLAESLRTAPSIDYEHGTVTLNVPISEVS